MKLFDLPTLRNSNVSPHTAWNGNATGSNGTELTPYQDGELKNYLQTQSIDFGGNSQGYGTSSYDQQHLLTDKFGLAPGTAMNTWTLQQMLPMVERYYGGAAAQALKAKIDAAINQDLTDTGRNWKGFQQQNMAHVGDKQQYINARDNTYNNTGVTNPVGAPSLGPGAYQPQGRPLTAQQQMNVASASAPQINPQVAQQNALISQFLNGQANANIPLLNTAANAANTPTQGNTNG